MATIFDIFKLVPTYDFLGETVQNRFHYQLIDAGTAVGTAISDALIDAWTADVMPAIQAVQSTEITLERFDAINYNSLAEDVVSVVPGFVGLVAGAAASSLVAYSMQLLPFTKDIKFGRKSIGGVAETSTDGNEVTAGTLTNLVLAATALASTITDPTTGAIFAPVISRIVPAAARPYIPFSVGIAEATYKGLGTMYTRKQGRGA